MIAEIVNKYDFIINNLGNLIEISGYKNEYIARKIGMPKINFSAKKNRKRFTIDEVKKIIHVIDNEDVEDFFLLEEMRELKDESTMTHKEFLKEIAK